MTKETIDSKVLEFRAPSEAMNFTGERYVSGVEGPIQHEHHHRYLLAASYCHGKDVLDIACGEGYGSSLLSTVANSVVGIDIDPDTVAFAQRLYSHEKLRFKRGDAVAIDMPDQSLDVVVSFETIEHFAGQVEFVNEVRRVLRPNGLFIVSSPNRPVYSDQDDHHNEFHVRELDREEFRSLLSNVFEKVEIWEQQAVSGSIILSEVNKGGFGTFETADGRQYVECRGLVAPHYFVAFATNAFEALDHEAEVSVLVNKTFHASLSERLAQTNERLRALQEERDHHEIHAVALASEVAVRDNEIMRLNADRDHHLQHSVSLAEELSSRAAELEWRLVQIEQQAAEIGELTEDKNRHVVHAVALANEISVRDQEIARLQRFEVDANAATDELSAIKASLSFKLASRVTRHVAKVPGIYRLRRYAIGVYWLVTLKLFSRLRERKAYRLIASSGYFDSEWYRSRYPDVRLAGMDPLTHFLRKGAKEGREPGPDFSVVRYREKHPHLDAQKNALLDAVSHGRIVDGLSPPKIPAVFTDAIELSGLEFEPVQDPEILVIIDARGDQSNVARQLSALAGETARSGCEFVLLVSEGDRLAVTGVLRHVCQTSVVGAFNEIMGRSSANIIIYISDNIVPEKGSIDGLRWSMLANKDLAFVSPQLVDPSSDRIFSAGYSLDAGTFTNVGEHQARGDYRYASYSEVDYFLPYCFAVRRETLRQIGGFDTRNIQLSAALTDALNRIDASDWKVACQRQACVYIDPSRATEAIEFPAKRATEAKVQYKKPKLLLFDAFVPTPDRDSGSNDIVNFMKIFIGFGYDVTFLPVMALAPVERYTDDLRRMGVICVSTPVVTVVEDYLKAHAAEFDAVFAYRGPIAASFVDLIRRAAPKTKIVFDTVDLHFMREQRQAEIEANPQMLADAGRTKQIELSVIRKSDATIVLSKSEQKVVNELVPNAITHLIPIVREVPGSPVPFNERSGVLFVGGFSHAPNIDAVVWFTKEVWPKVRERLPELEFKIVGSNLTPEVSALADASSGIRVLGFVPDITDLMETSLLSVAPLRYGAGIKGKVVSSLCYGLPCVATSVAAEGMGLGLQDGVILADDPDAFVEAVVRLSDQPDVWEALSKGGVSFAQDNFSMETIERQLKSLLMSLGLEIPAIGH